MSAFSSVTWIPESLTAKSAPAMANWMKRSIFLTSFFPTHCRGSKFFTSHPKWVECWEASKRVMGAAPDTPAWMPAQVSSVPMPSGDTSPMPVTTTLRSPDLTFQAPPGIPLLLRLVAVLLDVVHGLADARDLLRVLVGDLD